MRTTRPRRSPICGLAILTHPKPGLHRRTQAEILTLTGHPPIHLYEYVYNNPVNAWDPSGLETLGEYLLRNAYENQDQGNSAEAHLFLGLAILQEAFGAEAISKVVDRGITNNTDDLSLGDYLGGGH